LTALFEEIHLPNAAPASRGPPRAMRQALPGVVIEVDQAVAHAIGLVEPDAVLVVHANVPERVHRPARIVRQWQPDALLVARLGQLALEIGTLERGVEALSMQLGYSDFMSSGPCSSNISAYQARCPSTEVHGGPLQVAGATKRGNARRRESGPTMSAAESRTDMLHRRAEVR